jgi:hypothetical protein
LVIYSPTMIAEQTTPYFFASEEEAFEENFDHTVNDHYKPHAEMKSFQELLIDMNIPNEKFNSLTSFFNENVIASQANSLDNTQLVLSDGGLEKKRKRNSTEKYQRVYKKKQVEVVPPVYNVENQIFDLSFNQSFDNYFGFSDIDIELSNFDFFDFEFGQSLNPRQSNL